jgi:peptidoglycan hydrolase-like protein with peptidoglycan-binding domain
MKQRFIVYSLIAAFAAAIVSGCETVPKKTRQEISDIKSRVETLETKVESVEARQAELAEARAAAAAGEAVEEAIPQPGTNISIMAKPARKKARIKEIQTALKNAGFYTGRIDGVKGRKTRTAIREFQKANGLTADGIVGGKTWAALAKYAEGPAEGAAVKEGVDK